MSQQGTERSSRPGKRTERRKQMPVAVYLLVLFIVAFLLLLVAYFQQQRQNAEATSDALKQSASAVESIQNLMTENEALRQQVEELTGEKEGLEAQADALSKERDQLETQLTRTSAAMDWFWQIDEAYVRGRYRSCRELIRSFEEAGLLVSDLPSESSTDTQRFSPAARYEEIYNALF